MCTIVALLGSHPRWPIIVAANRDERYARPSSGPARLDAPATVVAGRDLEHGGTWFGVNAHGLAVAIADQGQKDESRPKRSRGLLVLDALACADVAAVDALLADLDQAAYNPCTLLYADTGAARLSRVGAGATAPRPLGAGLHVMVSGLGAEHARAREAHVLETLAPAALAALSGADLRERLAALLRSHDRQPGADDALCRHREAHGTVSSFVALLAAEPAASELWCASGAPCRNDYVDQSPLLRASRPAGEGLLRPATATAAQGGAP